MPPVLPGSVPVSDVAFDSWAGSAVEADADDVYADGRGGNDGDDGGDDDEEEEAAPEGIFSDDGEISSWFITTGTAARNAVSSARSSVIRLTKPPCWLALSISDTRSADRWFRMAFTVSRRRGASRERRRGTAEEAILLKKLEVGSIQWASVVGQTPHMLNPLIP